MRALSSTSYAILGLLAVRSWSAYELAKQMDRTFRWYWPRAESVLYEETKNLVAHGLATAAKHTAGRRSRTVYTITERGRQALAGWLGQPGAGPVLNFEALIQVAFADQGTKEQLLATLRSVRRGAEALRREALARCREYDETGGPSPERLHVIALVARFLLDYTDLTASWAAWAEEQVDQWDDVTSVDRAAVPPDAFRLRP